MLCALAQLSAHYGQPQSRLASQNTKRVEIGTVLKWGCRRGSPVLNGLGVQYGNVA